MHHKTPARPVTYLATVKGVREVTLVGGADYEYWKVRLATENLVPAEVNGRAEVFLSAVQMKWMGVSFREFSVSLRVLDRVEPTRDGVYLASSFNTSRLLAFIERHHFRTPYRHAYVEVNAESPWGFNLFDGANAVIRAERHGMSDVEVIDELWEVCIFLPHGARRNKQRDKLFFARLSCKTQVAPYSDTFDALELKPANDYTIVQSLADSNFAGVEWRIRNDATHARSMTYDRGRS